MDPASYNRGLSKRAKIVIGLGVVLVVILILVALLNRPNYLSIGQIYPVPGNFNSATAYGDSSIVFSDNNALVEYDYATARYESISPSDGLAAIDSLQVSTNKQFFLFHQTVTPPSSQLSTILSHYGYSYSPFGYWWLYDSSQQQFTPLPDNVLIAKIVGSEVYTLSSSSSGESITTYSASGLRSQAIISVEGVNNFFPVAGGFLLQTPTNSVLFTSNGTVTRSVYKSTVIYGVLGGGNEVIGVVQNKTSHDLELLNFQTNAAKTISDTVIGQPVWSPILNTLLYASGQINQTVQLNSYDFGTQQTYQWVTNPAWGSLSPSILVGQGAAIVTKSSDNYFLIGNNLTKPPTNL